MAALLRSLVVLPFITLAICVLPCACSSGGGGGAASQPQPSPTQQKGDLAVKIELDLTPIRQAAITHNLFGPASTFHQSGTAGEFSIEVSLVGVNQTYTYQPFVPYTLGQALNNTSVVLDVPLNLFGEYPAGAYALRIDQIGSWGVNFYRQDIHNDPTLYFTLPGTPASIPVVIPGGGEALVIISISPQFSHAQ